MKKLILTAALSIFSFNSFAEFSLTCPDIYQRTMLSKEAKKERAGRISNDLGKGAFIISLGAPAVGLALLVPAVGLSVYSSVDSKEDRVLQIMEEGNRNLIKLTKKLQKKVSSDISADEVLDVVKRGLESGLFCQEFPHLYSPKEVKEHVEAVMKSKYANRQ